MGWFDVRKEGHPVNSASAVDGVSKNNCYWCIEPGTSYPVYQGFSPSGAPFPVKMNVVLEGYFVPGYQGFSPSGAPSPVKMKLSWKGTSYPVYRGSAPPGLPPR